MYRKVRQSTEKSTKMREENCSEIEKGNDNNDNKDDGYELWMKKTEKFETQFQNAK